MARDGKKVVVLTGATRGLGRAMAEAFRKQGHTVAGCGRSTQAVAELQRSAGDAHDFAAVDVTDDDAVRAWAERVLAKVGPPDLLLNNAAVINETAPLWQIPRAEFDRLVDVNIKGVANVLRHFLPAMVKRKAGVVVNFSSA
jgi:NADP-dependent 3-hydroxy acid dehydrogenase YdfG